MHDSTSNMRYHITYHTQYVSHVSISTMISIGRYVEAKEQHQGFQRGPPP